MTEEQKARARGFTQSVIAESDEYTLEMLIQPNTDLDSRYSAFDTANAEYIRVNGWLFIHEFNDTKEDLH